MATNERKIFTNQPGYDVLLCTMIKHTPFLQSPIYLVEYSDVTIKSDFEFYGLGSPQKFPWDGGAFYDLLPTFVSNGTLGGSGGQTYTGLKLVDVSISVTGIL